MVTPQILDALLLIPPGLVHWLVPRFPHLEIVRVDLTGLSLGILLQLHFVVLIESLTVEGWAHISVLVSDGLVPLIHHGHERH